MPCNNIDKALVVYRFSVNNNIAYIMTKLKRFFTAEMSFQSNPNVIR